VINAQGQIELRYSVATSSLRFTMPIVFDTRSDVHPTPRSSPIGGMRSSGWRAARLGRQA